MRSIVFLRLHFYYYDSLRSSHVDDLDAWGTDGHDDEDGYRCGSEDRWYIGDYGDWRFTGEEYIFENSPENRFPTLDIFPKY